MNQAPDSDIGEKVKHAKKVRINTLEFVYVVKLTHLIPGPQPSNHFIVLALQLQF